MVWESVGITYNLDNNQATTGNSFNWLSVCYGFCHPDSFSLGVVKSPFGMNCPAPPEWYHLFTENRSETALALWFTEWVRIPEDHTPKPSLILLPIPLKPATHLWHFWCCGSPWASVIAFHQAKRLFVCILFYGNNSLVVSMYININLVMNWKLKS